jgi:type II secretory pathway pseudopilin PulG
MVEMILVIVIMGIVFALGGLVLGRAFESYRLAADAADAGAQARLALERMGRELRAVRTAAAGDLAWTANSVRFIDLNGNAVCFYQAGTQLLRSLDGPASACGTTAPQPLADHIAANGFTVAVLQANGAAAGQAYYVALTLTVAEGAVNETFRVTVKPRMF